MHQARMRKVLPIRSDQNPRFQSSEVGATHIVRAKRRRQRRMRPPPSPSVREHNRVRGWRGDSTWGWVGDYRRARGDAVSGRPSPRPRRSDCRNEPNRGGGASAWETRHTITCRYTRSRLHSMPYTICLAALTSLGLVGIFGAILQRGVCAEMKQRMAE
jgi:hypothetical protein